MFQPRVKLEFVRRYCPPSDGWQVLVDIDAAEEGRTGGEPASSEGRTRRRRMRQDGQTVREELRRLGATVGGSRAAWYREEHLPKLEGDRDIVAFNRQERLYVIAEVEGASTGQPEQKLYKAIGQLVVAASGAVLEGWRRRLVLVVQGQEVARHVTRVRALEKLDVAAVALGDEAGPDRWLLGSPLPPAPASRGRGARHRVT